MCPVPPPPPAEKNQTAAACLLPRRSLMERGVTVHEKKKTVATTHAVTIVLIGQEWEWKWEWEGCRITHLR